MSGSATSRVHPLEALMLASAEYDRPDRLAAVTGVSERAIRNVIAGKGMPRLATVKAIAPAFDVDPVELLERIRAWSEAQG